jgi:hypothetical protein
MKYLAIAALVCVSASSFAQLSETFSYADGNLTSVSGNTWSLWGATSGDSSVVGGVARIDDGTDVIRTFNNVFASASVAHYSFDLNVQVSNSSEDYQVYFSPASAPFNTGQNYTSSLGLLFDNDGGGTLGSPPTGTVYVAAYEGTGSFNGVQFTTMTAGVTHNISGDITKGAGTAAYTLYIDGVLQRTSSFLLTDARGINAVEFYQGASGTPNASATIDNLFVTPVPEPATMAIVGGGLLALVRRRRSSR